MVVVSCVQYLEDIAACALLDEPLHRVRHIEVPLALEYVLLRVWLPESHHCHLSRFLEVILGALLQAGVPRVLDAKVRMELAGVLQVQREGSEPLLVGVVSRAVGLRGLTDTAR